MEPRASYLGAYAVAIFVAWIVFPFWSIVAISLGLLTFLLVPPLACAYVLRRKQAEEAGRTALWIALLLVPAWLNPETVRLVRYLRDIEQASWVEVFFRTGSIPFSIVADLDPAAVIALAFGVAAVPWLARAAALRGNGLQAILAIVVAVAIAWPLAVGMGAVTEDGTRDTDRDAVADDRQPTRALATWLTAFLAGLLVLAVGLLPGRRIASSTPSSP